MPLNRRDFLGGVAATGLALTAGPVVAGSRALRGSAFGSGWSAVVPDDAPVNLLRTAFDEVIAQTNAVFSPYRADSSLRRFNRATTADWIAVPADLTALARESLRLHGESQGAFDPTVGPLVARFGFGPIQGETAPLGALDIAPEKLRKADPGLTLDFCGIAKGHALDRMIAALKGLGVPDALVELGGEVRTIGRHPDGRPWQVAVERPLPGALRAQRIVAPGTKALATSGHAAQGAHTSFGTVSHLVDPRSRRPADPRLASVTVLAGTATKADALATTLTVLGPDHGVAFAAEKDIDALFLFLIRDGTGLREIMTGRFADHVKV